MFIILKFIQRMIAPPVMRIKHISRVSLIIFLAFDVLRSSLGSLIYQKALSKTEDKA